MNSRAPRRPSLIFLVVMLASASVVGLVIIVSPYIAFHEPGAISFGASLNSTEISQNQTIRVTVSDRNTLLFANQLPLSKDWGVSSLPEGSCLSDEYPFGVAVFQGRYGMDNVSSAKVLKLYVPGVLDPCLSNGLGNSVEFKPHQNISASVRLNGYYTSGETPAPGGGFIAGIFHPFLPGEYTLVAGDQWGHVQILYFQVKGTSPQGFLI
jgi:hypothetical protein